MTVESKATITDTGTLSSDGKDESLGPKHAERFALVVVWATEVARVGEVFLLPASGRAIFGRGDDDVAGDETATPRLVPVRQRPGQNEPRPPISDRTLSRRQAIVHVEGDVLRIVNEGRAPMVGPHGERAKEVILRLGETVAFGGKVLFVCVRRPEKLARAFSLDPSARVPFGEADVASIVGESPEIWNLRDSLAFLAARSAHVMLLGPSGSGKELAAQAIHALSNRQSKRLVARNAATFPTTLVEAELFGNVANYPNHGMPERPGLVGEAAGSTLFLDEIGDIPEELQTRLLRLLDEPGEYQRLGDARPRRATVRVIVATNRPVTTLRDDVAARFKLRVSLPGLGSRREDVPLVARHLLRRIARMDPAIGARFLEGWNGEDGEPRIALGLVRRLVGYPYKTHVRELERLLWRSLSTTRSDTLELTPELAAEMEVEGPPRARTPSSEDVRVALDRAGGVKDRAWRDLGLANRWALMRLMKKYGIAGDADDEVASASAPRRD